MAELGLVGAISIKGKNVKLKYIHPNSVARILLAEFDDIWVDVPEPDYRGNIFNWEVVQGIIYTDQLTAIPESEIAMSNMPIRFTLEFTLEDVEYAEDYCEMIPVAYEPIEIGVGACSAVNKAFTSYLPTNKVIFVSQWEGKGEWLWRLDRKKWV
jgi:hypothetical protein